jgi:hypothetical protein
MELIARCSRVIGIDFLPVQIMTCALIEKGEERMALHQGSFQDRRRQVDWLAISRPSHDDIKNRCI